MLKMRWSDDRHVALRRRRHLHDRRTAARGARLVEAFRGAQREEPAHRRGQHDRAPADISAAGFVPARVAAVAGAHRGKKHEQDEVQHRHDDGSAHAPVDVLRQRQAAAPLGRRQQRVRRLAVVRVHVCRPKPRHDRGDEGKARRHPARRIAPSHRRNDVRKGRREGKYLGAQID